DTGRDFQFDPAGIFDPPFAAAFPTRFFDNWSGSAAARTGLRYLEKAARTNYLPATAAGWTIDRARARFRTAAGALVACIQLANFDFFLRTKGGLLQRNLHVVTQIGTPLPFFCAIAAATTEKTLENSAATAADHLSDHIDGIVKSAAATDRVVRKPTVP